MSFESWAAFAAASSILLIIPGPTILLVVSYALGQGWRTALPMAVGVALGDFTATLAEWRRLLADYRPDASASENAVFEPSPFERVNV